MQITSKPIKKPSIVRPLFYWCLLALVVLLPINSYANDQAKNNANGKLRLTILEPYLNIHTGPGKNYPVFYIAQHGEVIEVQKRRNEWFKVHLNVNGNKTKSGWVHRKAIGLTALNTFAQKVDSNKKTLLAKEDPLLSTLFNPNHYFGFNYGQMSAADLVGIYIGKHITDNFSLEIQAAEFLGATAQGHTWAGVIAFTPFPAWRLSPFTEIGAGGIQSTARGTNSQQNAGSDKFLQSGLGLQLRLSDRYRLRFEYRHLNILTSNNDNGELETWHIGFSGYF